MSHATSPLTSANSRRSMVLWAVAAGTTYALCWMPLGLGPFMPLSALMAIRGLGRARTVRDSLYFGCAYGVAHHGVGAHFLLALVAYSKLGFVFYLMAILYFMVFALLASCGAFWLERRSGWPRGLGFVVLAALGEWLRTLSDLSLPADLTAHAFGTAPAWLAWNGWIGPYGFAILTFGVGGLLATAWDRRKDRLQAFALGSAAVLLWSGPPLTDLWIGQGAGSVRTLNVGIVQPVITVQEKLDRASWPMLWQRLESLTLEAARGADLVIWPETTRPGPLLWNEDASLQDPAMTELARKAGVPILYGCEVARVRGGSVLGLYNAAALARPEGGPLPWYGKQRLLPFAEGVPFARLIGWDPAQRRRGGKRSMLTLIGNFFSGPGPEVFEVGPARIGVLICFEGLYPPLVRASRGEGANVLALLTNDAWWGRSIFAPWHARMMSSRARENGIPVVRAANSGISSITDRHGRMGARTRWFETTTLQVPLSPSTAPPTFYARHGEILVLLLSLLVVVAGVFPVNRRRSSAARRGSS